MGEEQPSTSHRRASAVTARKAKGRSRAFRGSNPAQSIVRAANAAVQVHGGYGYVDEFPVQKYLRDARVSTLYEGTSQIQKLLIGRALTGESAFL